MSRAATTAWSMRARRHRGRRFGTFPAERKVHRGRGGTIGITSEASNRRLTSHQADPSLRAPFTTAGLSPVLQAFGNKRRVPNRRSVEGEHRVEGSVLDELGLHYFPQPHPVTSNLALREKSADDSRTGGNRSAQESKTRNSFVFPIMTSNSFGLPILRGIFC